MRARRSWLSRGIAAAALLAAPGLCDAQVVRGVVTGSRGEPLPSVVVVLLNERDSTVARALTNASGEFRFLAPADGRYRITTLRIGFRPTTSETFAVQSGAEALKNLTVAEVPSALDTIRVRGRNACRVRPDSAMATFAVWEQVRAALMATQLTAASEAINTRVVVYRRKLEPEKLQVLEQSLAVSSGRNARIWASLSPDSLRAAGYIQVDPRGDVTFYAPDLNVLLSSAFVEDHCFRLDEKSDDVRVGIAFEPTGDRRRIPEIRGTMWVDRKSSQLTRLEFTYTNVARELENAGPGGEVRFARLSDHSWVISNWHIRMPLVLTQRMENSRSLRQRGVETRVHEIRVNGGDLAMVSRGTDTLWSQPPVRFRGRVVDSASGAGVVGAWLTLRGTRLSGLTDDGGTFDIAGALPGEYALDVRTPSLDSVGASHAVGVTFADTSGSVVIAVPSAAAVVARLCSNNNLLNGTLIGTVSGRSDSLPRFNARVVAEWRELAATGRTVSHTREALSGVDGRYRVCGVPLHMPVTVRAESDSLRSDSSFVRLAGDRRFSVTDLWLDRGGDPTAIFEGTVMSEVNAQPIADAEVALAEIAKNAFTDSSGRFRITGITPGTHSVSVRRLGFKQAALTITFVPGASVRREILLSQLVVLDTIAVRASARDQLMREFEDNRRLGLGKFWTRAQLEKLEGLPMTAVLSQVNGAIVMRGTRGHAWMGRMRGVQSLGNSTGTSIMPDPNDIYHGAKPSCYASVWVDNVRVYTGRDEEPLFNINSITPGEIEAMEYYVGPAQTPARYAGLNTVCGVLVIWTRRFHAKPDSLD